MKYPGLIPWGSGEGEVKGYFNTSLESMKREEVLD